MPHRPVPRRRDGRPDHRLVTDGGTPDDDEDPVDDAGDGTDGADTRDDGPVGEPDGSDDAAGETSESAADGSDDDATAPDRSTVDVMEAGEAEPADPEWEPPDMDDVPEFEVRADQPVMESGGDADSAAPDDAGGGGAADAPRGGGPTGDAGPRETGNPTAGMPNDAQAPGATAVSSQGTEAYVAALELCARLPDDVALPAEAADLVPAAVEAELEQDIQTFTAAEFDTPRPHVDTLDFEERDGDVWLRIRIGLPREDFDDLDPERLRRFALQELEGVL